MYEKYLKPFTEALESTGDGGKNPWEIFTEFCLLGRMSFQQALFFDKEREEKVLKIQQACRNPSGYSKALAVMVDALENEIGDFLGTWATQNNVLYGKRGQFFTPYHVSRMMAEMIIGPTHKDKAVPIKLNEPACGAGGMVIAMFSVLRELGYAPRDFYVIAQDIDALCANMTYLQCTLLDIPAVVIQGNTLALETIENFPTLSFVRNHSHRL